MDFATERWTGEVLLGGQHEALREALVEVLRVVHLLRRQ